MNMDMDTTIFSPMIKCNGGTLLLLFVVTGNDIVKLKVAKNGNCNGAVTVKNRLQIKTGELLVPVPEVK